MNISHEDAGSRWETIISNLKETEPQALLDIIEIIEDASRNQVLERVDINKEVFALLESIGFSISYSGDERIYYISKDDDWGKDGLYLRRETLNRIVRAILGVAENYSAYESKVEELYMLIFTNCKLEADRGKFEYRIYKDSSLYDDFTDEEFNFVLNQCMLEGFFISVGQLDENTHKYYISFSW